MSDGFHEPEGVLPVALAPEQAVEHAGVLQRAGALGRADVEIDPPAGLARAIDEAENRAAGEPARRADHRRAAERRRPAEVEEQREEAAHRRSGRDRRVALAAR